jgi:hypothetical protein
VVDATTAIYDDANDKLVESRLLASDEADLVDMAGLNSAKTITIMYDALGVVSVFEADHCGDTLADTPIVKALPFLMTLAMKNNTYRQATLTIGIDGLITVQ